MKKLDLIVCILLCCSSFLYAQDEKFITAFLERFETSHQYTLVVAEMMPEEDYNFKASPESMSFAENLLHIGWAMDWHSQSLLGGREARDWKTDTLFKTVHKSKAQMIARVDETFNNASQILKNFDLMHMDDEMDYFGAMRSKRQIFLLLADHITHHRAQMIVPLRLKGIIPPRYVLYQ